MAPSSSRLVDATLGIDIGSTSTRACLWVPSKQRVIHVENRAPASINRAYIPPGDYSSVGYPFEPDSDVYLGGDVDPERQATSLKYGFYVLANVEDEDLLKQYILIEPLMERKADPVFRGRVRQGLVELLTTVNRDVQSCCQIYGLRITRIGLSIPAQWKVEFEDVYKKIVTEVFGRTNIFFHTETEALAHILLQENLLKFRVREGEDYGVFLFFDFGGHNMNGCIFNLVQGDQDKNPSFYRIEDPFGVGGGSEHWTYYIGKKVLFYMREAGEIISPEREQEILEKFNARKGSLGPNQAKDGRPFLFGKQETKLPPEEITHCFDRAHAKPFSEAKHQIERVSKYGTVPLVVVFGGTAKHPSVQARLREFCDAAGVPEPHFVSDPSITYSSGTIAHGVALAASNFLTIPQFMERGAAFGLQMKSCPNRGNTNPEGQWENIGYFLLSKNKQVSHEFEAGGKDEFKIICDPFFESCPYENLQFNRCYDILYLGRAKRGLRTIKLSLVSSNGSISCVIRTTRKWKGGPGKQSKEPFQPPDHDHIDKRCSPALPMYFDGGTNCAFVELGDYDITELDFGMERFEQDNTSAKKETVNTKACRNHDMQTRSRRKEVPPPANTEMASAEPQETPVLSSSGTLNKSPKLTSRTKPLPPARLYLPTERLESPMPAWRSSSSAAASSNVQLSRAPETPASVSHFKAPGPTKTGWPSASEDPLPVSRHTAPTSNMPPSPQGFRPQMHEPSSGFGPAPKLLASQNQAVKLSGRSKPHRLRGKVEFTVCNKTVRYPGKEGKQTAVHETSQSERKRKIWVLDDSETDSSEE